MQITVKALPIKDIIIDLAQQMDVEIDKDNKEFTIQLPKKLGKGFIRGANFESGIGIIQYNCTFFCDMEIHFTINRTHPLKFIMCSEGRVQHSFERSDERHDIDTYQNIIVSSHGYNGHVLYFKENEVVRISSLEIIRKQFVDYISYGFGKLHPRMKELLKDVKAENSFLYHGNYSIMAADIADDIFNRENSGFLRSIFLEAKVFEMLLKQIMVYQDDQREDRLPQVLRRSDVEKVKRAVDLIKNDLSQNYSVEYLAKEVGTNVNKLQDGFKYMFNLTVNKYVQQVKLEAAKEMLNSSDNNISQIVNQIGLNNRSYFSKIFKERYGVSPKYFLNSAKNQEEIETEDEIENNDQ